MAAGKPVVMVTLVSSDGQSFQLLEEAALLSAMVRDTIQIGQGRGPAGIPIRNITGQTLSMVVVYCNKHYTAAAAADGDDAADEEKKVANKKQLREWDEQFINLEQDKLYDILVAANNLGIDGLVDLCCWRFADMMKGKSASEIRVKLGIRDDFTSEQRAQIEKDSPWVWSRTT
ncbi:hypothetical protein GUJ93_ZPchr0009g465 [Zizania palustris]|uniref:SKP1-like protein n=1 Tax=Zizania palustris TaxID=103762 RepID=A0A8J5RNI7_ZIZPA|nr:hypothetical protein GUJ93_ZPchr0009g465 [Zizania palustris]